mmetsp:Transcript_16426/g.38991  ORF Transcript_16426/g.38991 Transcript_16426/m.38991 type:complete len:432 (+) Transcript_16426:923-2218(+)
MGTWESVLYTVDLLSRMEICPVKATEETAAALKSARTDLLIVDGSHPCGFLVAELIDAPRVALYTFQPVHHILQQQHGVFSSTSLWPTLQSEHDPYRPTFAGRLRSAVLHWMMAAMGIGADAAFRKNGATGTLAEAAMRSRLALLASDPFLDLPVQLPPYVHQVGAITPAPGGALPEELASLLAPGRGRRTVFHSFGTTGIGNRTAALFTEVWERMPDVTVLWKVRDAGSPLYRAARRLPNVHLVEWVDQNAVLAHGALGAFISHGGHNSVSEAAYHGVPTLAVPGFADQSDSAQRLVHHGSAIKIAKRDASASAIEASIRELLDNPAYKQAATRLSSGIRLFRSRRHPLDRISDLLEDELEAMAADAATWPQPLPPMPWWQKHQVDVYFGLGLVSAAAAWAGYCVLRACCGPVCCRRAKNGSSAEKVKRM